MKRYDHYDYTLDSDNITISDPYLEYKPYTMTKRDITSTVSIPTDLLKEIYRELKIQEILDNYHTMIEEELDKNGIDSTDEAVYSVAKQIYDTSEMLDEEPSYIEGQIEDFNYDELSDYLKDEELSERLRDGNDERE